MAGKPLLQYTLEAATESTVVTDILLSSDNDEIIDFTQSFGIDVSYRRPPDLASDHASQIDTVLHGLHWWQETHGSIPDKMILLQPTSPLRLSSHIDGAVQQFEKSSVRTLISVHEMVEHPYECIHLQADGWDLLKRSGTQVFRRQDYQDKFYYINGAIYIAEIEYLREKRSFYQIGQSSLYVMEPEFGVDIDTLSDLQKAESIMKHN